MARRKCQTTQNAIMDLEKLSEEEVARIVEVIEKDFAIRAIEQKRLKKRKKEMEAAKRKLRELATRRSDIDDKLCVICLDRFILFFNPKEQCFGCRYNVCKKCCTFIVKYNAYICRICLQRSDLIGMSCDWFYEAVKKRFKEFGSVKIARCLLKDSQEDDKPGRLVKVSAFGSQPSIKSQSTIPSDLMSPQVLDRVKQAQIKKFREALDEITSKAVQELIASEHECEREFAVRNLQTNVRSSLKNFSQVLYVTLETNNSMLNEDEKLNNIHDEVQALIQREIENFVGHEVDVNFDEVASLCSEVESCMNGEKSDFEDSLSKHICDKVVNQYIILRHEQKLEHDTQKRASLILDDLDNSLLSYEDINLLESNLRRRKTSTPNIGSLPPHVDTLRFLEFSGPRKEVDPDVISLSGVSDRMSDSDITENIDYRPITSQSSDYSLHDPEYKSSMEGSWIQLARHPLGSLKSLQSPMDEKDSHTRNGQNTALKLNPTKSTESHPSFRSTNSHSSSQSNSQEKQFNRISQVRNDSGFIQCDSLNSSLNHDRVDNQTNGSPALSRSSSNQNNGSPALRRSSSKLGTLPLVLSVLDGESASLKTRMSNSQTRVNWYRLVRNKRIPLSPSDKYEFVFSASHAELIIWDVCEEDEGDYQVIIVELPDQKIDSEAFFNVKVKENNKVFRRPEFVRSINDQEVDIGSDVTFKCRVTGYPEPRLFFFKDGKQLAPVKNKIEFSERQEPIFLCKILNVTEDDEAEYSCLVSNRIGRCHCEAQLTIAESSDIETYSKEYNSPTQNKSITKSLLLSKPDPQDQVICVADFRQNTSQVDQLKHDTDKMNGNLSRPSSFIQPRFNGKDANIRSLSVKNTNDMNQQHSLDGFLIGNNGNVNNYSFQEIRTRFDSMGRGAPIIRNSSITGRSYQGEKVAHNSVNRNKTPN